MAKRLLILGMFFAVGITSALAQKNTFEKVWNVGASFGVNLSQASFAKSTNGNPIKTASWAQYQGGLAVRYLTEKNLGILAELNYSQQGWRQRFEDKEGNVIDMYSHQHQLNYINMPILTHIYFGNKVRFFINLGPEFGFLISEKETFNDKLIIDLQGGLMGATVETGQYFKKADRKFEYGIIGGMGLELCTGIGNFAIEGRYSFGLSDFYNNKKSDHFQRSANRVIGVKMTYYTRLF